jgi:hypothetical protein
VVRTSLFDFRLGGVVTDEDEKGNQFMPFRLDTDDEL